VSPVSLRPHISVDWRWIAAFGALTYVVRCAMRAWDPRPDTLDLIVWGGLAAVLVVRSLVARAGAGPSEDD
jgi:hypothetical protein